MHKILTFMKASGTWQTRWPVYDESVELKNNFNQKQSSVHSTWTLKVLLKNLSLSL